MTPLEKSIIATLVYYDVLDRPLTGWEIFKYLIRWPRNQMALKSKDRSFGYTLAKGEEHDSQWQSLDFKNILDILENSPALTKLVSQQNGFYFLNGRQKIIKERIERQKMADQKWKKARRVIKFLQMIPFIRLVAVSGSLAMNNTKDESDIDLLIVTQKGRIWTCRGLITLFLHLICQHRHGNLTKDRFCLNHYLTDQSLKIPFKSLYNAQTYAHLVPILEVEQSDLYNRFQKDNDWIKNYLFSYPMSRRGYLRKISSSKFLPLIRKFNQFALQGKTGYLFELLSKKFQERRIRKDPHTYQTGGRVVFIDSQLEFHPDSPEKGILEKYNQKMRQIGLVELGQERDSGLTRHV